MHFIMLCVSWSVCCVADLYSSDLCIVFIQFSYVISCSVCCFVWTVMGCIAFLVRWNLDLFRAEYIYFKIQHIKKKINQCLKGNIHSLPPSVMCVTACCTQFSASHCWPASLMSAVLGCVLPEEPCRLLADRRSCCSDSGCHTFQVGTWIKSFELIGFAKWQDEVFFWILVRKKCTLPIIIK